MPAFDCIVIGAGGFGSGTLDALARRGVNVLGIERFGVAHGRGSSHGETRIIRKAYFEHPDYVPLCIRAYELWEELQAECPQPLYHLCGLMLAGPAEGEAVAGAQLSASRYGVPLDELTPQEAMSRFPGFRIPEEFAVVFEPEAGFLRVEEGVRAHVDRALQHAAALHLGETVVSWTSDGQRVTVQTDRDEYTAAGLVITAGAWASGVLPELADKLSVLRKPQFWHEVTTADYHLENRCPGYLFERPDGIFYGFPTLDGKVLKVAEHSGGAPVDDPTRLDREIHPSDTEPVRRFVADCLPGVKREAVRQSVCMYTMTPDHHFLVDRHPEYVNVVIGAGFSGHGFKFTTVLGEALADLVLTGTTDLPIGFLSLNRETL